MSSKKRVVLKCFLVLVSLVIVGLLYLSTSMSVKGNRSRIWPNKTMVTPNGTGSLKSDGDKMAEYAEGERTREAQKVSIFKSEWKAASTTVPTFSQSLKPLIPVIAFDSSTTVLPRKTDSPITHSPIQLDGKVDESNSHVGQNKTNLTKDDIPRVTVEAVNCAKLIEGDVFEQKKADLYQKEHSKVVSDDQIYSQALDCRAFLVNRKYILKPASAEEAEFPLAFSILLFKDVELFERLLRAIYRPQNFYCVHIDKKSEKLVKDAVAAIVNCFRNVFMAPEQFAVHWGTFSVLEPELSCMKELLKYKKWKYFINLTGQEFPLKTNWEIVQILKIFNGANNLEGTVKRRNTDRTANKPPPPANITLTKGSVHIVASRKFVRYIIYDKTSLRLREWVKDTYVPDETYFSTLNFNPHLKVPGSYLGIPETDTKTNLFITRFKNWGDGPFNWPCAGKRVRMVCIFAVRDLPLLAGRREFFANKFYVDYEPLTLDCLEELHYNRTLVEVTGSPDIDRKFYETLDFVNNHL